MDKLRSLTMDSSLSKALRMASTFGMVPDKFAVLVDGLALSPPPTKKQLSDDWIDNLDVLADSVGSIIVGVFDALVAGMSVEEIQELDPEDVLDAIEIPIARPFLKDSWEVCVSLYLSGGPLSKQVKDGKIPADGLVAKALFAPMAREREASPEGKALNPLQRMVRSKKVAKTSVI